MTLSLSKRGPALLPVLLAALFACLPSVLSAQVLPGEGDDLLGTVILTASTGTPVDVGAGDIDEDGIMDLVTLNDYDDSVAVLIGNGDGTFFVGNVTDAGYSPQDLELGDLNSDGHLDAAVLSRYGPELIILLGNGVGELLTHWYDYSPDYPTAMALAECSIDGDDDLDIMMTWPDAQRLQLFNGDGDGTYTMDGNFTAGREPNFITFAELTDDDMVDLAVTNYSDDSVTVLKYDDGNYTHRVDYGVCDRPRGTVFSDLDDDGDPDLAVVGYYGRLTILENLGNGNFGNRVDRTLNGNPWALAAGDLDLDGNLDLAMASLGNPMLTVFLGNGDLTFQEGREYLADYSGSSLALSDLDGDGDLDVAVGSNSSNFVAILLNSTVGPRYIVTGPGRGEGNPPLVRLFDPGNPGSPVAEWTAYGADNYGVNVACGDLTLDSKVELLTGPGPGEIYGPHVRGFREDGTAIAEISFLAYGTHKFGVNVACGDVDGDDYPEIVTGAGPGAVFGPHVRGWNWDGGGEVTIIPTISYFAYGTPKWGVNVSCGDIDGDGFDEIVTGAGPGAVYGPHVRGWNVDGGPAVAIPEVNFLAYGTNKYGVNVACGDLDGDGIDEIITGAGPGIVFGPHVRAWNWDGSGTAQPLPGISFFAYDDYLQYGVNVGCGDVDGDGVDEILTGPGPREDYSPWVRAFDYEDGSVSAVPGVDFMAYDPDLFTHGVKVAGAGAR